MRRLPKCMWHRINDASVSYCDLHRAWNIQSIKLKCFSTLLSNLMSKYAAIAISTAEVKEQAKLARVARKQNPEGRKQMKAEQRAQGHHEGSLCRALGKSGQCAS
eukprot:SAG11_NODE_4125_length_2053_cov_1.130502_1_plen_105_part_00